MPVPTSKVDTNPASADGAATAAMTNADAIGARENFGADAPRREMNDSMDNLFLHAEPVQRRIQRGA
jgi:hypothetical protein